MRRLSELLHADVRDRDDAPVGTVEEVRLVQDGPLLGGLVAALRVDALIVSHNGFGIRLGYYGERRTGPWLVRSLMNRLERKTTIVDWHNVASWDADGVHLSVSADELPRM